MPTFTALTTLAGQTAAQALGDALEALDPAPTGVGVFEVEDGSGLWEVGGFFTAPPDDIGLALLARAHGARDFTVSELPETDWVAHVKRELAPVEAGRFFVYGGHDADKVPPGAVSLRIEAAMAFGTGHHGTTLGCLTALDEMVAAGMVKANVVDIGCGTAVLAMAAARIWSYPVFACDIDAVAVDVARANVSANGLDEVVQVIEAAGFDHSDLARAAPFDLVFANILKGPLIALAPEMSRHISPGGHAILSGILTPQADDVINVYESLGFKVISRREIGDWTTLVLENGV